MNVRSPFSHRPFVDLGYRGREVLLTPPEGKAAKMARHRRGVLRDRYLLQELVIAFRTRPEGFRIGCERFRGRGLGLGDQCLLVARGAAQPEQRDETVPLHAPQAD